MTCRWNPATRSRCAEIPETSNNQHRTSLKLRIAGVPTRSGSERQKVIQLNVTRWLAGERAAAGDSRAPAAARSARGSRAVFGGPPKTPFHKLSTHCLLRLKEGWWKCLAGRQTPQAGGRRSPFLQSAFIIPADRRKSAGVKPRGGHAPLRGSKEVFALMARNLGGESTPISCSFPLNPSAGVAMCAL